MKTILLALMLMAPGPAKPAVDFRDVFKELPPSAVRIPDPPADPPAVPDDLPPPETPDPEPAKALLLEITERSSNQIVMTVYSAEWCAPCKLDHKQNGNGDSRIALHWTHKPLPRGAPQSLPCYEWKDSTGKLRYANGRHTLDALVALTGRATVSSPLPPVLFGRPWFESNGRTSVQHLMSEHRLTWEQLAPYANNPDALNRIHGWKHEGRGSPPPGYRPVASRPPEPQAPASGVAGSIHGRPQIVAALNWIRTYVGEGVPMKVSWDRTGAQTFPLLRNQNFSRIALFGRTGRLVLDAPGCKLPADHLLLGYDVLDGNKIRLTGDVVLDIADNGTVSAGQPVGLDPGTLSILFAVGKAVWGLLHPQADLTLGGNVSATAVLKGETLTVDFQQMPAIRLVMLFTFNLGVQRMTISPSKIHLDFVGSRFIKSRDFTVE